MHEEKKNPHKQNFYLHRQTSRIETDGMGVFHQTWRAESLFGFVPHADMTLPFPVYTPIGLKAKPGPRWQVIEGQLSP